MTTVCRICHRDGLHRVAVAGSYLRAAHDADPGNRLAELVAATSARAEADAQYLLHRRVIAVWGRPDVEDDEPA